MRLGWLAQRAFAVTPLPEMVLRYRARRHVTVMGYHRILPPVGPDYPFNESVISATPEEFAREIRYLKANTDVISVAELLAGLRNPAILPPRPAVITFDDAYVDNHQYAFPLLKEAGLPACFFVCTALPGSLEIPWHEEWVCCLKKSHAVRIDSPFAADDAPYDLDATHRIASISRFRQKARYYPWKNVPAMLDRLRKSTGVNPREFISDSLFMSWDQAREISGSHKNGGPDMEIGGHTRTHPILSRIDDPVELQSEIAGCFDDLRQNLGAPPTAFAYPFGYADYMSPQADEAIDRAGFQISFSFINGFAPRIAGKTRRIPRIHASHGTNYQQFRFRTATAPIQN